MVAPTRASRLLAFFHLTVRRELVSGIPLHHGGLVCRFVGQREPKPGDYGVRAVIEFRVVLVRGLVIVLSDFLLPRADPFRRMSFEFISSRHRKRGDTHAGEAEVIRTIVAA